MFMTFITFFDFIMTLFRKMKGRIPQNNFDPTGFGSPSVK